MRGEQWYKPHRTHAYQRLTDVGFSHLGSATLVTLTTFVVTAATVLALPFETQNAVWSALLVVLILALYVFLPTMLGKVRQKNGA